MIGSLEGEQNGLFDGVPAHTIVSDLFGVEQITSPVSGIEKEAVTITGLWMRCYTYIHKIVRQCRDPFSIATTNNLLAYLDKAITLWIGRLQVHGDNSHGTMLYNLAERAGTNFGQDHGEVPVNRKFMDTWQQIKDKIEEGVCSKIHENKDAYKVFYDEVTFVTRKMNIPLIQNFIHHWSKKEDNRAVCFGHLLSADHFL